MILFGLAGLIGAGYVLSSGGQSSPGYALIPMLFSIICSQGYTALRKKEQERNRQ